MTVILTKIRTHITISSALKITENESFRVIAKLFTHFDIKKTQQSSNFGLVQNTFYSIFEALAFRKRHHFNLKSKNTRKILYEILSNNFQFLLRTLVGESPKMTHEKFESDLGYLKFGQSTF